MSARRLALAAALAVAAAGAAWAAGGSMKPWPGGATPALSLRDLDGKEHKLADYKGKVVVLNFWATWCDPCREEMPAMQRWEPLFRQGWAGPCRVPRSLATICVTMFTSFGAVLCRAALAQRRCSQGQQTLTMPRR